MFDSLSLILTSIVVGTAIVQLVAWLAVSRAVSGTSFSDAKKARIRLGFGATLIVWFAIVYALASTGFYNEATLIKQVITLIVPFSIGLGLLIGSQTTRDLLDALPQTWMIAVHTLRLVGIVFLLLGGMSLLPQDFATRAGYGDIAAGITAPIVALWYTSKRPGGRGLAVGWNLFGALDFAMAAIGLPALAVHFASAQTPDVLAALTTLLVIAVPILLLLHVASLRGLFTERRMAHDSDTRQAVTTAS